MVRVTDHRATDNWRWRGPWHSNNAHVFSDDTLDQLGGKPVVLVHAGSVFLEEFRGEIATRRCAEHSEHSALYTAHLGVLHHRWQQGYSDVLRPRASAPMAGDIGGQSSISSFSVRFAPAFAVA